MPFFAYKGRNTRGESVQGTLESPDSGACADMLFNNGITPIEISQTRKAAAPTAEGGALARLLEPKVGPVDVMLFSRQMHTLLKAGVPIMRALSGLQESTHNKTFAGILRDLRESLDSGRELSVALHRHPEIFSQFYVSMVRVGESTGRLDEIFLQLFYYLDFEKQTKEQIRAALRYPMFVVIAMTVAMAVINMFVIPSFAKVYKGFNAELPMMTQMLIAVSDFTVGNWPLMAAAVVAAVFGFRYWITAPRGKYAWDRLKLRLPVVGSIIKKASLARFARSFSLAARSGVPIVQGLTVVSQTTGNVYISSRVEQMRTGVERGETILRTAVTAEVFTPVVLQMVAVGEETGALDDLMQEIAEMYEREVEYEVKNLSARIEPILIVGLGILVLILALGVFLPIWDLGKAALHK